MPPAASRREQILANVATTLAMITLAGGYSVNIGTVSRGHLSPLETFGLPTASILPVSDQPEYGAGVLRRVLTLTIRLWIDVAGGTVATSLEGAIADVQRVMQVDSRRGGCAETTLEGPLQYLYLVDAQTLAGADVGYDIPYETKITTPLEAP